MKRPVICALALAALAAGTSMSASAQTRAYIAVEPAPAPAYVERHYGPPMYAYDSREYEHFRHECRAPRWDPNERYMPGQEVRRNGQVYMATEVSRHVYNVNSPPEWTPNYWRPVDCR
jgi:hypothetical protein